MIVVSYIFTLLHHFRSFWFVRQTLDWIKSDITFHKTMKYIKEDEASKKMNRKTIFNKYTIDCWYKIFSVRWSVRIKAIKILHIKFKKKKSKTNIFWQAVVLIIIALLIAYFLSIFIRINYLEFCINQNHSPIYLMIALNARIASSHLYHI